MPDISKCTNTQCPQSADCYRFTCEPSDYRQAYCEFPYDMKTGKCDYFIETLRNGSGTMKIIKIALDEYDYDCADGCCTNFGTTTTVNGVELDCHNQDTGTILKQVLEHLGYTVELTETYNGE